MTAVAFIGLWVTIAVVIVGQFAMVMTTRNILRMLKAHQEHLSAHNQHLATLDDFVIIRQEQTNEHLHS